MQVHSLWTVQQPATFRSTLGARADIGQPSVAEDALDDGLLGLLTGDESENPDKLSAFGLQLPRHLYASGVDLALARRRILDSHLGGPLAHRDLAFLHQLRGEWPAAACRASMYRAALEEEGHVSQELAIATLWIAWLEARQWSLVAAATDTAWPASIDVLASLAKPTARPSARPRRVVVEELPGPEWSSPPRRVAAMDGGVSPIPASARPIWKGMLALWRILPPKHRIAGKAILIRLGKAARLQGLAARLKAGVLST